MEPVPGHPIRAASIESLERVMIRLNSLLHTLGYGHRTPPSNCNRFPRPFGELSPAKTIMKTKTLTLLGTTALLAGTCSQLTHAASFQWDANPATPGVQDGGGSWDAMSTHWINGSNVSWTNANDAVFGAGTDGTYAINVALDPSASTLRFDTTGYTLSATQAQTVTFTSNSTSGGVIVAAGKTATIGANVTLTSASNVSSSYYLTGTGTLVVGNGGTIQGSGTANTNVLFINGTTVDVNSGGLLTSTSLSSITGTALFVNGALNVNGGTADSKLGTLGIGQTSGGSPGVLTLSSGEVLANGTNGTRIGSTSSTTPGGTLHLNGGTLSTLRIHKGTGTVTNSVVNFNGGTLKKGVTSNEVFLGGIARANVRDGGAIIDTNGFNSTITQALAHSNIGGDAATDGGLTKNGAGLLILSGANTYNGGTIINAGTLQFGATSVPSTGAISIQSGGTLNLAGAFTTTGVALTTISTASTGLLALTGDLTENINFGSHSSLRLGATTNASLTGTISPSGGTYRLGGGGASLTLASANALTGANDLIVGGAGTNGNLILSESNDFSGTVTIQSGTLQIRGAILNAGSITNNSALAFSPSSGVTITPASISGTGILSKTGAGTLVLSYANSYQGDTAVTGGILRAAHSNAFGSSSVTVTGSYQQIQLEGDLTITNAIRATGGGGPSNTDGAIKSLSGTNTLANFGFAGTGGTRVHVVQDSTLIFSNAFASDNEASFRVLGSGTAVFLGNNSSALGAANSVLLGDGANAGPLAKAGHDLAFGNATIDFQANSASTLQSDSSTARNFANNVIFRGSTATLGAASTGDLEFGGLITLATALNLSIQNAHTTFNGAINQGSDTHGLTKSGAGTLTLAGTGSYTGPTTITNGKLVVNGNISTSSGVHVDGGILAGSGTVGSITLDAGTIAPGNSIGTLSLDELTWNGGSLEFELDSLTNTADLLEISGAFNRGAGSDYAFDFIGTGANGFSYKLVEFASTDFSITDFSYTNLAPGLTGNFGLEGDSLTFTVVPEPSSLSIGLILSAGMLLRRRRTGNIIARKLLSR
jgi:fibronectin-binding autotransporter adhesin